MNRLEIRVKGMVQGVGFRPFVYARVTRFGLAGAVSNDSRGVTIEVVGDEAGLACFLAALRREAPPLAAVRHPARDRRL
ncbi:MAG TPA: acylphosphatase [Alphaproteobacteria bacterium]|nr:acylphosphatase [Alphaproteobacteria bacterium]